MTKCQIPEGRARGPPLQVPSNSREITVPHAQTATPRWALILGASTGFGAECGIALAEAGYDICGVHLDRKAGMALADETKRKIESKGRKALFFNVNAADAEKRKEVVDALIAEKANVAVLLHSL